MKKASFYLILFLALAGLVDSAYLTWEHFNNVIPPCTINHFLPILSNCGEVLRSSYSIIFGIPLALTGIIQYGLIFIITLLTIYKKNILFCFWLICQAFIGALASLYFMYLQIFIIKSICLYCTLSALISFTIFFLAYKKLVKERLTIRFFLYGFVYQKILKPIFFLFDAELIHNFHVDLGELLGYGFLKKIVGWKFKYIPPQLKQKLDGINFSGPIGLAAGFDYDARLTQILPSLGFGFQTVGTVTNSHYQGNPPPRLGRLPKSKSLMVNKGFKNKGAKIIAEKLNKLDFETPVGLSIGITNSAEIRTIETGIKDIISAFKIFEKSSVRNSYYELNISCPNLVHTKDIGFYQPKNLNLLLSAVDKLRLKKPVFIKMPIEKTNQEVFSMIDVIVKHKSIKGVIIGNLQKDRKNSVLVQSEVKKFKVGNFSGKPCEQRSNELIKLAYKNFKNKLIIIGCGGVFSAKDAYKKIRLGATLVQLITGMIFQGPQLISQINFELVDLAKRDGFKNIKEAIGYENH
ncbi:MAG: quinone-dependent dihydroorotate dehydrogenase [Candidatus Roizmanbacteria bacterium]